VDVIGYPQLDAGVLVGTICMLRHAPTWRAPYAWPAALAAYPQSGHKFRLR